MPEISIIIPAYNAQNTIKDCLDSIFNQTLKDWEVIVVEDGSTDDTLNILKAYGNKIKIISQKNSGAAAARNRGEKESKAPYIIFCDADVVMKPEMLKIMRQTLEENPDKSFAYCAFKFGLKKFKLWPYDGQKLKQQPYIHTTSLIYRQHFPGFDQSLKRFQDWDLWLTMLKQNHIGIFIPEILFKVKPGGTMSNWLPKFFYKLPISKEVKAYKKAEAIIKSKHRI